MSQTSPFFLWISHFNDTYFNFALLAGCDDKANVLDSGQDAGVLD